LGVPAFKLKRRPNGARGGSFKAWSPPPAFPRYRPGGHLEHRADPASRRALADEARLKGASVLARAHRHLHRSTLNGRNFECYSEDPWLAGEIGVPTSAACRTAASPRPSSTSFGNESEHQRMTINSRIGERALRELYLLRSRRPSRRPGSGP